MRRKLSMSFALLGSLLVAWAPAATLPPSFQETVVLSGLTYPTAVRFAPDGRVFVAQKNGIIRVFPGLGATSSTVFADLRVSVQDFWDRGLLGLAIHPNFPATRYVYALYTYDAPIGGTAPTWGDTCPTPPGATTDGCVVSGRLSRLTADATGNVMVAGSEQVFLNDWCQQFPSHSIGNLAFGPDGALYVSGGDGASFNNVDYGQYGNVYAGDRRNPCGDPPGGVGGTMSPPSAEGGSLRSQSLRRVPGDPVVLGGTILRVDPLTGAALSTNPLASSSSPNAQRIVAYGLRNPFRFTIRPGTSEIWVGDVGWNTWEEIHRILNPTASPVTNLGWPCYEGNNSSSAIQSAYQAAGLSICSNLYATPAAVSAPYYAYDHGTPVVSGEACPTANGSAITGLAFYAGGSYPSAYNGTLFFADHSRNCIWSIPAGAGGLPDKTKIANFVTAAANPVDLEIGPGGDLYYVDLEGGTVRRVQYTGSANQAPTAVIQAAPTSGPAPLPVAFDGRASSDPDPGDGIAAYSWDLNGDGVYGDATTATATFTYTAPGTYTARLRVTDRNGATGTTSTAINVSNTAPVAVIDLPTACPPSAPCWAVGDRIDYLGHASDAQQGTLPASALAWSILVHHCPTDITSCHAHQLQSATGTTSGYFYAPDHDYPAYLEVQLTATDSGGLQSTARVLLYPRTVNLSFATSPSGLTLGLDGATLTTPFTSTVIVGSTNSVSAPSPQDLGGVRYAFQSWSDGLAASHTIVAGDTAASYRATYVPISADLSIVKSGQLNADGSITFTLRVANAGPATAQAVVVSDAIPSRTLLVSATTTLGTCTGTATVSCAIGTLTSGQSATVTIRLAVTKGGNPRVTNTGTVSGATPDPNQANNSSTVQVRVR